MTPDFGTALERFLRVGLPALEDLTNRSGAKHLFLMMLEEGRTLRVLYSQPQSGIEVPACWRLESEIPVSDGVGLRIDFENPLAERLRRLAPDAASFVLFSPETRPVRALVALGFAMRNSPDHALQPECASLAHLFALTTWGLHEVYRLRAEVTVTGERLGQRKLIERAKALLQTEFGFTEQAAYEHIRKLSRQRRVPMEATAKSLIRSLA